MFGTVTRFFLIRRTQIYTLSSDKKISSCVHYRARYGKVLLHKVYEDDQKVLEPRTSDYQGMKMCGSFVLFMFCVCVLIRI